MDNFLDLVDRILIRVTAWVLGHLLERIARWLEWMDGDTSTRPLTLYNVFDELEQDTDGNLLFQKYDGSMVAINREDIVQVSENLESDRVVLEVYGGVGYILDTAWWQGLFLGEDEVLVQARSIGEEE